MPTPSPSGKRPSKKVKSTVATADPAPEREPRGARRKRETRQRLLEAALRLMAKKGMEGVAINEITEAADVGFGSFYNHFESKEAIYGAVVEWVFEDFADALDSLVSDIADPAEVVSVSVRHTLLRAQRELVWGQFLIREGYSARVLERGLGQRLLRDIQRGIASGRFKREDALMSFLSVGGTVLASISVWLQFHQAHGTQPPTIDQLGFNVDDLPQRAAKMLLLTLGLTRLEAEKIAYRPLPGDGTLPEMLPGSAAAVAG
jgi:AcrR family transcriptional regulator